MFKQYHDHESMKSLFVTFKTAFIIKANEDFCFKILNFKILLLVYTLLNSKYLMLSGTTPAKS